MVWVPGGEFMMGSDAPDASPAERPAHRVRVDGFWMDETDVPTASSAGSSRSLVTSPRRKGATVEDNPALRHAGATIPKQERSAGRALVFCRRTTRLICAM